MGLGRGIELSSLRPARPVPTWRGLACPSRTANGRGAARDGGQVTTGITLVSRQWSVVRCKKITTDNGQHPTNLHSMSLFGLGEYSTLILFQGSTEEWVWTHIESLTSTRTGGMGKALRGLIKPFT